jgi:hypothetical protein
MRCGRIGEHDAEEGGEEDEAGVFIFGDSRAVHGAQQANSWKFYKVGDNV